MSRLSGRVVYQTGYKDGEKAERKRIREAIKRLDAWRSVDVGCEVVPRHEALAATRAPRKRSK